MVPAGVENNNEHPGNMKLLFCILFFANVAAMVSNHILKKKYSDIFLMNSWEHCLVFILRNKSTFQNLCITSYYKLLAECFVIKI